MPKIVTSYKELEQPVFHQVIIVDGEEWEPAEGESIPDDAIIYNVRGMTPIQQTLAVKILRMPPVPNAPYKSKQVTPLRQSGRIDPNAVHDEMYQDFEDPDYKKAVKEYEDVQTERLTLVLAWSLMCCVDGMNPSDTEIEEALGEKAYKYDDRNIESLRNRVSQVADILLPRIEARHMNIIQRAVDKLSGLKVSDVNFT